MRHDLKVGEGEAEGGSPGNEAGPSGAVDSDESDEEVPTTSAPFTIK